ncbi:hypothetical protein OUY22_27590 [Nonomuraea sp. MCN248]|uniref:Uncharacterized protein n=1 Tax=Nonomuraea corallina TaxID=2989783 RepID=A0ABT4SIY8_9ACTN|nr:hypothetical protein [Nonomuraea corallina]MDA0637182.1 hypothetical protein [Nonomuraea corallina]
MFALWCDGEPPDSVVIYDVTGEDRLDQAEISAPPLTGDTDRMSLARPPAGWRVTEGSLDLREGRSYEIRAYRTEPYAYLAGTRFTMAAEIPEDRILIQMATQHADVDTFLSPADFRTRALHYC